MEWSLKELYRSFDSKEFINDLATLDKEIETIIKWTEARLRDKEHSVRKLEEYIGSQMAYGHLFSKLSSFCELSIAANSKNEKAIQYAEKLEKKNAELTRSSVIFAKWLASLENLDVLIDSSAILTEHDFFLRHIIEKAQYLLSEKEEVVLAKMRNTGSSSWANLQNLLTSTLIVDLKVEGKTRQYPLPIIRNMAYEKDGKTRKKAYLAELEAYKKIESPSAACLNSIKGEVITIAGLRGYASPLDMTLKTARMDRQTLDAMLEAMRESLPAFRKYYRRKGELLGHKKGLPFYDMFAPLGNITMKFTYDEAKAYIIKNFGKFSRELAAFADSAFKKNWVDPFPREGKTGGAFCYNLHTIKESRILTNFTGSFNNVVTLAHELGHAYHGRCLTAESFLNSEYPMPLAETASIFCETIIINAGLESASKDEAFAILESDISGAGQVVIDIYSRYLFETALFERRTDSALPVGELKEIMLEAQKEAYGDGLDERYLHPYMWLNKPHYYFADHNFYNFPYAFGLLFAKGLYGEFKRKGPQFVERYDSLLRQTGKQIVADVAKMMTIDIRTPDFWRSSLRLIEEDIEKFLSL